MLRDAISPPQPVTAERWTCGLQGVEMNTKSTLKTDLQRTFDELAAAIRSADTPVNHRRVKGHIDRMQSLTMAFRLLSIQGGKTVDENLAHIAAEFDLEF